MTPQMRNNFIITGVGVKYGGSRILERDRMPPAFEWHENKARLNLRKHGVSFIEAASVFGDPLARIFDDPAHSAKERREIIIGRSSMTKLLLVCFIETEENQIRIISARRATKLEQHDYEENVTGQI
jgi:hypothetical protein